MKCLGYRAAFASCVLGVLFLTGCGSGGSGGTNNTATATPSMANALGVVSGGRQTYRITFNASDSHALSDLVVTTDLTALPSGWSGPTSFSCASVTTGSGCVLSLTYAPTGAGSGTLAIAYTYKNNSGTAETGSQSITYSSTTNNNVVATASLTGQINAVVGASGQSVGINFTTDDGNPATLFSVTTDLGALPAGWSSTAATFSCATVSTGNGCQLPMTYAPTAAGSGTLTLTYSYTDDSGAAKTGSLSVPYASTTHDDVVAVASPSGQVNAVVGASGQSVGINFTSSDGNPATNFVLTTDLTLLPSGWSSTATTLSCATVSTGNGCNLPLTYTPSAADSGTLTLTYSYNDDSGAAKTGTVLVDYAATTHDSVGATVTPSGQVNAVVGSGSQFVSVQFTTNDGNPATALLLTTDLSSLPVGWSSTVTTFSCATVSTGNGCQLPLTYAPGAAAGASLILNYSYVDNSGVSQTGSVSIPYVATTHDNVVATQAPSGQVNAVLGSGSQQVSVTFTTDDVNNATGLQVTGLGTLPTGWSGPGSLACATVSTGSGCSVSLTYTPSITSSGTLTLNYGYSDNSGTAKTGSLGIQYAATANDNVTGTPDQSSPNVTVGGSATDNVTFTTDDGNAASSLTLTSSLGALPAGWSSAASSFSCGSVSTGTTCQLPLTFTPTASSQSGTLMLNYSYRSNSGATKTGSVNITYTAIQTYLYVTDSHSSSSVQVCPITGATLVTTTCTSTGSGFNWPTSIAFYGGRAYVTNDSGYTISMCTVSTNGALINCITANSSLNEPQHVTFNAAGTYAYVWDNSGTDLCTVNQTDGTMSSCTENGMESGLDNLLRFATLAPDGVHVYGVWAGGGGPDPNNFMNYLNAMSVCTIASDNTIGGCTGTGTGVGFANLTFATYNGNTYSSNQNQDNNTYGVLVCPINRSDGSLGSCQVTSTGIASLAQSVAVGGGYGYSVYYDNTIQVCPVNTDGTFGTCSTVTVPSAMNLNGVAIH